MNEPRRLLVTSALPYANGDIHLGHLVEHFITDFWARYQKLRGHECVSICADDSHGAPIMVEARKQNITPETLIARMRERHVADLKEFEVEYDHYSSTHTQTNQQLCEFIYTRLKAAGHVTSKTLKQYYCTHDAMFLPDRFVKGTCPKCGSENQYGDSCDSCSAVYSPEELKAPKCALCASSPEIRPSEHYFVKLSSFNGFLRDWVSTHTSSAISNKLHEWLNADLADWCFTRDEPYFGFELPDAKGKFFYVWFDAPIGYIATTAEWCEKNGRKLEEFWHSHPENNCEIYHNIGKDIVYFHSLFWPVMLKEAGFNLPKEIWVHGMLTINGEKLSKSKGTFINARSYLNHLPADYLRYYFACKISNSITDIDLNFEDFASRVNSDLIGKITNIISRCAQLLEKKLDGQLGRFSDEGQELIRLAQAKSEVIGQYYESRDFAKVMLEIRSIADFTNKYIDEKTPWKTIAEQPEPTRQVLTVAIHLFRIMSIYLKPILPSYVEKVERFFDEKSYTWESLTNSLEMRKLGSFTHLLSRLDEKKIALIVEETKSLQEKRKET